MLRALFSAALLALVLGAAAPCAAAQNKSSAPSPKAAPAAPAVAAPAPVAAPAAAPAAGLDALSQLDPAPTAAELQLYKETKTKSPGDLPKFLATRKYLRQLWAAFPDGKLDADKAPAPPDDLDFGMALDFSEQMVIMDVKVAAGTKEDAK